MNRQRSLRYSIGMVLVSVLALALGWTFAMPDRIDKLWARAAPLSSSAAAFLADAGAADIQGDLTHHLFLPLILSTRPYPAIIVEGPWMGLPDGAGAGLALDGETGALMLDTDMQRFVYVGQPEPERTAFLNGIYELVTYKGALYLGYGDPWNNRGPVNIVGYRALAGAFQVEMTGLPEEMVSGWRGSPDGRRFFVAGEDSRESWTFGSFYVKDNLGWHKRRTVYGGVKMRGITAFQGKLYADYGTAPSVLPITYTFALVSSDQGASWQYERVDSAPIEDIAISTLSTVNHASGETLYALIWSDPVGSEGMERSLYRFDGDTWETVIITDPRGAVSAPEIRAFGDQLVVRGILSDTVSNRRTLMVYALDGAGQQKEITFLQDRYFLWDNCTIHNAWLYCAIPTEPMYEADYQLYRTRTLHDWEHLGPIVLAPGVSLRALAFSHDRLYVGATNAGWWDSTPGRFELWQKVVPTITNTTLHWDAYVPQGAELAFQVRSSDFDTRLSGEPWVGPDGTESSMFTTSGTTLHPRHDGHRLFQIVIHKTANGSGDAPTVKWLSLIGDYGSITLAVDEGAGLYTAANITDTATYQAAIMNLAAPISGAKLFFDGATPPATTLRFQLRSGATREQLEQAAFVGPDGTTASSYTTSGETLWAGHAGDHFIQYRAVLSSSDPTVSPYLRQVVLLTRDDGLDHLSIAVDAATPWVAGQGYPITVAAHTAAGDVAPIFGELTLQSWDAGWNPLPSPDPEGLTLRNGAATAHVALAQAGETRLCATLAGVTDCSSPFTVAPNVAASFSMTVNLPEPHLHWSPVGQVGAPFSLHLTALDFYGNVVKDYAGTVKCERWRWQSEGQLFAPYTFLPIEQGQHTFANAVVIGESGEWNLVCFDQAQPGVAGSVTVQLDPIRR